ncbi:hypothetical protein [Actinoplanes sp. HUAS TT8]|uniref:hypothetical protein n=1 Tax=Actinoplanes sp. HUAS TT8 TaxID=3447453 RepID=UPI003F51DC82
MKIRSDGGGIAKHGRFHECAIEIVAVGASAPDDPVEEGLFESHSAATPNTGMLVSSIAVEVVTAVFPDELDLLPELLARSAADPRQLRVRRLRAPVGMGIDLALATPALLSALSFVAAAAATNLIDGAMDRLSSAAYEVVTRLFRPGGTVDTGAVCSETAWSEITALWTLLLTERGMRADLAAMTAAQIVAAMRRRDEAGR